jgi:hypothetical protein
MCLTRRHIAPTLYVSGVELATPRQKSFEPILKRARHIFIPYRGYPMSKLQQQKLFESHVSMEPNTGCWLWIHAVNKDGYGRMRQNGREPEGIHRIAYKLYIGPIPEGKEICHICDTPACGNPLHLYAGTHSENMNDSKRRGRSSRGLSRSRLLAPYLAKLTEEQVILIRSDKNTEKEIGRRYCISRSQVGRIRRKEAWNGLYE